jgi:hypothetical protein
MTTSISPQTVMKAQLNINEDLAKVSEREGELNTTEVTQRKKTRSKLLHPKRPSPLKSGA